MKRRVVVRAASDAQFSIGKARHVQRKLQEAFDAIEMCDSKTRETLDLDAVSEDLHIAIKTIANQLNPVE